MSNEVDAFGRTIPQKSVEVSASKRSRSRSRDRGDRGRDGDRDRDRDNRGDWSGYRGRDRDMNRRDSGGRGRSRERGFDGRRSNGGGGFNDGRHGSNQARYDQQRPSPRGYDRHQTLPNQKSRNSFGRSYDTRDMSPVNQKPASRLPRMQPMKSFSSFMSEQDKATTPEEGEDLYKKYQLKYTDDASNHFFESNKYEEWFREKFDPLLMQQRVPEMKQWSLKESASMTAHFREILSDEDALAAFRLTGLRPDESKSTSKAYAGHHLGGHLDRTLYLSNIPPCCTRAALTFAIKSAIKKASEAAAISALQSTVTDASDEKDTESPAVSRDIPKAEVERISMASPTVARQPPFSFTRAAWVTLTEGSSGMLVRGALRDLKVEVPLSSVGLTKGDAKTFTFRLRVTTHTPRSSLNPLPAFMSDQSRIAFDVARVMKLAALLDEESGLPAESNLAAIVENCSDLTPCDTLDIGIAYLRRVHFYVYYSGRKFDNEAELLLRSSSVVSRSVPSPAVTLDSVEGDTVKANDIQNEVMDNQDDDDEEKADEKEREGDDDDDDDDASDSRRKSENETVANDDQYHGKTNPAMSAVDQRVSQFLDSLSKRIEVQRSREESSEASEKVYKDDDERDAETIAAAQDEIMTEVTKLNCLEESEKVRCAVPDCSKLFKGKEFLKKHLQNKHPELALERMVRVAESFMRDRFEALPFKFRTLPPLELEGYGGKIEEKAVKDVRDIALGILAPSNPRKRRLNDEGFDSGRGGGGGRGGYQGRPEEQVNNSWGAPRPPPPPFAPPQFHSMVDSNARTVSAYRDVDAPVAVACVDADFGVSLPPPKRKKVIIRKKK